MSIAKTTAKGRMYAEALNKVIGGADIYDYGIAVTLREIERYAPDLIIITEAQAPPPGHEQQPYFGAITTKQGKDWLQEPDHD